MAGEDEVAPQVALSKGGMPHCAAKRQLRRPPLNPMKRDDSRGDYCCNHIARLLAGILSAFTENNKYYYLHLHLYLYSD